MASIQKICVIIPTWNHKKDVLETIESLAASDTNGFILEICVVDNASDDGTYAAVKQKYPEVKLIKNTENLGFVGACNIGMRWALDKKFDYVALLNDDTLVDKNLIKNIYLEHQKEESIGAISPKIYFAKGFEFHKQSLAPDGSKKYKPSDLGRVIWYAGGSIDWKNVYGSNRGVDEVDKGQYDKAVETDFATGCFVMFKPVALKDVGLYDEKYFAYMEDADHSRRLKRAGWKVLYSPNGFLWHKVAQSSGIGSEMNDYFLTRNRMIFGLKYAPIRAKIALIRESLRLLSIGRKWQKIGIRDYYSGNLGKGSWKQ